MKIAVTGPYGQLGSELIRQGCLPLPGRLGHFSLAGEINRIKPDAIINCAAMTDVDGCESDPDKAMAANATGVSWLSRHFNGHLIQVSTDYVFDGLSGPYGIDSRPNPLSVYGWSKLGGEVITRRHRGPWLIVRTTVLFSRTENNFVSKVAEKLERGEVVTLPEGLRGSPTYVPALAEELIRLAQERYTGVAHVAGSQVWSRIEFAQEIAKFFGYDLSLIQVGPAIATGAPRPQKAGLISGHISRPISTHHPLAGLIELARARKEIA